MSQSSMEAKGGEEIEVDELEEEMEVEQMVEEQIEEEEEETDEEEIEEEELYETIKYLLMAIQAVVQVLKEFMITFGQPIKRPLNRRPITIEGYNYVHKVLKEDCPEDFRQRYRMYPNVFVKGDIDQDFQMQEQQQNIANERRYNIALDMWRDAHNDNNVNGG
ncbi:hypothetical protein C1H46_012282 [Malus baccata]|uniref:Uncharacterized protein n=1 Tax=Malus baccata TaxID=106549 RepID=A0A540MTG3_MALBA|nr:hypothetical protein C1H46_012282 [Malus baccata]